MQLSVLLSLALAASAIAKPTSYASINPKVSLNQTTVIGTAKTYDSVKIEKYLGIPFGAPPIGDLRFAPPEPAHPLAATLNATDYGAPCAGFIGFSDGLPRPFSEDCLTLNILRPASTETEPMTKLLPVFVWIYGGGLQSGATSDPQYDLTPMVVHSKRLGTPVIAASMNYRLGGFGFLGNNAGLYDQRLALQWLQNNVAAFGGDPKRVTIFGESAGAFSVAYHINSRGSAGLFGAAIMQSGTSLGANQVKPPDAPVYDTQWATVADATGCAARDVECLRKADYDTVFAAFRNQMWFPVVDGDMVEKLASEQIAAGEWNRVPVIVGANRDEGTAYFWNALGLETDSDVRKWLEATSSKLSNSSIDRILELYPNDPAQGSPFGSGNISFPELGAQYKRGAAISGDLFMHAGRRATAKAFSKAGQKVWSYRFDQPPWDGVAPLVTNGTSESIGATHYAEITSVFGTRHPDEEGSVKWKADPSAEGIALSDSMQRKWIGFAVARNPNLHRTKGEVRWEEYGESGMELSLRKNATMLIKDNYREEALKFWTTVWDELST